MNPEGHVHSFLFADLVGYTALTEERGDEAAAELAVEFAQTVRRLAVEHGAQFVKAMGDAVMVRGSCATEIVRLALRLAHGRPEIAWCPPVRIGIHTGPAVARDGDWYGATVNVAARLADCAQADEVLVTESTGRRMNGEAPCELCDHGRRRLRGVVAPVRVFEARPLGPGASVPVEAGVAA